MVQMKHYIISKINKNSQSHSWRSAVMVMPHIYILLKETVYKAVYWT